jgi:23S rRNA (cytidine1920-2'-O)/16S rRNA (cytidine1409-2'-O)-methyltransferase
VRADVLVCELGFAPTRTKAQELIRRGRVTADGVPVDKPGATISRTARVAVAKAEDFVSRGGEKLGGALDVLGADVRGAVVVDVGASTGGFSECVLRRGARKVYAVDVGHGQLAASLRRDARVVVREGTNAKDLGPADFDETVDVVLVDASFIGLTQLAPALFRILGAGGRLVALVKPQFEAGLAVARRARGVIKDPEERARAIQNGRDAIVRAGFVILGECDSPLPGPRGNLERFVYAAKPSGSLRAP